tara:strand:+ start:7601 stop:7720 length:120 start_codon:yes stop_codon:yes gene_type:complete
MIQRIRTVKSVNDLFERKYNIDKENKEEQKVRSGSLDIQ